jgi:hypothetical protein
MREQNDLEALKKTLRSFEKLVHKALRLADPKDTNAIQRLASGITAISRAHTVIEKQTPAQRTWEVLP